MNEYEQSIEHFIGIYVATGGAPSLAEHRREWAEKWFAEHDRVVAERAWDEGARWGAFVFGNDASVDESRVGLVPPDNPHRKEQENKPDLRQCGSWWHFSSSPR